MKKQKEDVPPEAEWVADSLEEMAARGGVPAWKKAPFQVRAIDCVRFLAVHGLATEKERDKIIARLRKRSP